MKNDLSGIFETDPKKIEKQVKKAKGLMNYLITQGEKYDRKMRKWEKTVEIRMCPCGSPYSFPKNMRDPGICLRCREPEEVYISDNWDDREGL